jgi:trans-2-enoyl-CoA reductase
MTYREQMLEHLHQAESLEERLGWIDQVARDHARANNPQLARDLEEDPQSLDAKNELAYLVRQRMEKYSTIVGSMASARDRHMRWAQLYALVLMAQRS